MSGYEELLGKETSAAPVVETPSAPEVVSEAPAAPVESAPAAVVETPQTPTQDADHVVPLNVLLRTREEFGGKLTAAEQRALAAERQLAEIRRKQEEAADEIPHPLDDPDGFKASILKAQQRAVQTAVGSVRQQHQRQLEAISKTMMVRHLGPEKFSELDKFIAAAPDQAHASAMREADPYGWFYEKFEQAQKARKAQEAAKQLEQFGGKSVEEIVADRLAAARAEWEAGRTQAPQPAQAQPVADTRPRNADGTCASPSPAQRHLPPSLALVESATAPTGEDARGGYDKLFKRG